MPNDETRAAGLNTARLPPAFGRYRPVAEIGKGAIGTVYRAEDPLIGREVAVKMIRTDLLDDEMRAEYRARFATEARAAGRCSHPGIVAVFDAGESEGRPYLVMELLEGETLQAILADPHRRAALDWMTVLLEVLAALDYAHGRHVIHRDIKPANIIVTPEGRAKITDFGIARIDYFGIARIDYGSMTTSLTLAGDMLGTPNYMAPEQVNGATVDHRADLFAVSAILYLVLVGRPPFAGKTLSDTLLRLTDPAPADLRMIEAGPFAAYGTVLRRGLAKSPAARFATAGEFAAALRGAAAPDQTRVAPAPAPAVPRPAASRALDPVLVEAAGLALARIIGPMARRHAAQAAAHAATMDEFLGMLARQIPNPVEAAKFLRAHGASGDPRDGTPTARSRTGHSVSGRSDTSQMTTGRIGEAASARGIPAHAQEAARTVLALYVGPIARVLVNRALRDAGSLDALADTLAREVDPADQPAFRRKLLAAFDR